MWGLGLRGRPAGPRVEGSPYLFVIHANASDTCFSQARCNLLACNMGFAMPSDLVSLVRGALETSARARGVVRGSGATTLPPSPRGRRHRCVQPSQQKLRVATQVVAIAVPLGGGFAGSMATISEIKGWYATIQKPTWNPPVRCCRRPALAGARATPHLCVASHSVAAALTSAGTHCNCARHAELAVRPSVDGAVHRHGRVLLAGLAQRR